MKSILAILVVLTTIPSVFLFAQNVRINEVSPANATLIDEDGELSDWVELFNPAAIPVSLKNYRIGDRNDYQHSWKFPDTVLAPGGFLLVHPSGKNKAGTGLMCIEGTGVGINPWNTWDAFRYLYLPVQGDFDFAMQVRSFLDPAVYARIGILLTDEVRRDNRHSAIFVTGRNIYTSSQRSVRMQAPEWQKEYHGSPVEYPHVWLRFQRRSDSVFFYSSQFGDKWLSLDSSRFEIDGDRGFVGIAIGSYDMQKPVKAMVSDIAFNGTSLSLADFEAAEPGTEVPGTHYVSRELHTHFKLDSKGRTVYLWDAAGVLQDSLPYTMAGTNVSLCHNNEGTGFLCCERPTPGAPNTEARPFLQSVPVIEPEGGIVAAGTVVRCTSNEPDAQIRYSLDGSLPTSTSPLYKEPFALATTAVVRARMFKDGFLPGLTATQTYLINEPECDLPIISIASDPALFWSDSAGILVMGPGADPKHPYHGANFWKDWEIPCAVQMFDNGEIAFYQDAGVKVQGRGSRVFPQKALRVVARDRYGKGSIGYKVFPSRPLTSYESIILRNSGQDWSRAFMRDALASVLAIEVGLDARAYRPVRAYLNGRYWGLYDLRERVDEHFIADHYNIPEDSIQLLETVEVAPVHGDRKGYCALIDTLAELHMSRAEDYAYMDSQMDIANYIDYNSLEVYSSNWDWPALNIQYWRSPDLDNKWRWIVYDNDNSNADFNSIDHLTSPVQQWWSNPPEATLLFRKLLENTGFKHAFLNRTADLLNTTFSNARVEALVDSLADNIAREIPLHRERWDTLHTWQKEVDVLRDFARRRPEVVRSHCVEKFELEGTAMVTLAAEPAGTGSIRFSTLMPQLPWSGIYFKNIPITATAIPAPGYRFLRWATPGLGDSAGATITLHDPLALTALFIADEAPGGHGIVINEIMYKPSDDRDSKDWVELYNSSQESVNLGGWMLKDEDDEHVYSIPSGTVLPAGGYLILSNDTEAFDEIYGDVQCEVLGDMDFGLGSPADQVRLYDGAGLLVDSVAYRGNSPWPTDASGTGRSIELLHPALDNTRGENWRVSHIGGTPGRRNGSGTEVPPDPDIALIDLECFPNPIDVGGVLLVQYRAEMVGRVKFSVADLTGREVAVPLQSGGQYEGKAGMLLETSSLAPGMYFVRAEVSQSAGSALQVLPFVVK